MTREELIVQVQKRVADDYMFRGSTVELKDQDLKGNYRVAVLLNGKSTNILCDLGAPAPVRGFGRLATDLFVKVSADHILEVITKMVFSRVEDHIGKAATAAVFSSNWPSASDTLRDDI